MIIKSACVINNKSHRFFWSKHWLNSRTFQSSFTWSSEKVKRTEKETDKDERNRKKPRSQIQLPFSFLKTLTLYHNGLKLFFSSQVRSKITQWNDRQSLTTPPPYQQTFTISVTLIYQHIFPSSTSLSYQLNENEMRNQVFTHLRFWILKTNFPRIPFSNETLLCGWKKKSDFKNIPL